jgi:hypothetical protein
MPWAPDGAVAFWFGRPFCPMNPLVSSGALAVKIFALGLTARWGLTRKRALDSVSSSSLPQGIPWIWRDNWRLTQGGYACSVRAYALMHLRALRPRRRSLSFRLTLASGVPDSPPRPMRSQWGGRRGTRGLRRGWHPNRRTAAKSTFLSPHHHPPHPPSPHAARGFTARSIAFPVSVSARRNL